MAGASQIRDTDYPLHQPLRPSLRLPERHFPFGKTRSPAFTQNGQADSTLYSYLSEIEPSFMTGRKTAHTTMHSFSGQK
ncbi:hypothetical protein PO124_10435 [Bacillus licheniformis]|nr:hypothetical protein [Bacillus licheniformis]